MNTPLKCAVALAALCIGASSAFADPTTTKGETKKAGATATVDLGTTPINRMSAVESTDTFTCTTTPQAMLSKRLRVVQTGNVSVLFQAEMFPGCRVLLSFLRDGVTVPGPGDAASPMAAHDTGGELSTNGFNFVDRNVSPGFHTYEVTCQCDTGTSLVDERSLIALHR